MATYDPMMTDFDVIREIKKRKRPWWKGHHSPMICEHLAKSLLVRMEQAAHEDEQLREKGKMVIKKLLLLKEFVEALHKTYLHRELLENGLLRVIGLWIKPAGNCILAFSVIRKRLLGSLLAVAGIEVKHLKQCELPKILMKLRVHKNETRHNRRLANELVNRWVRMVYNIPTRVKREQPRQSDL
uniref:TFIIS N-terminal domain-containing protein n=1 Tax=Anopheles minimus TaxID=112268 RepID=A0A182WER5_9DIPT